MDQQRQRGLGFRPRNVRGYRLTQMRLDEEALRKVLADVERRINVVRRDEYEISIDKIGEVEFYHYDLLIEGGYIKAEDIGVNDTDAYVIKNLTMAGHDLLKKTRNDTVWQRAKSKLKELGGDVPLRIFEKLLDQGWDQLIP